MNSKAPALERLRIVADALDYLVVDEATAVQCVKVLLASQDDGIPRRVRKALTRVKNAATRELVDGFRTSRPRGRKPRLGASAELYAYRTYLTMITFFRQPENRPAAEQPFNRKLLVKINKELTIFGKPIRLSDLTAIAQEIDPGRAAKLAVALSFGIRPGTMDKIITRRRQGTVQEPGPDLP